MKIVVIDPGHGGRDPGAVDPPEAARGDMLSSREDEIAYDIARLALQALIGQGVQAYLSRRPNEFASLRERCELARRLKAQAFVSVHCNSAANPEAAGIETFCYPGASGGAELRNIVHYAVMDEVRRYGFPDRGLRTERYYVINPARNAAPAALLECGFLSNIEDEKRLQHPVIRDGIARGIAHGVLRFLGGA